jgi:hypothetical protein
MSGQQKRRGRDPEVHEIHASLAAANAYVGLAGEMTFVADVNGQIIQLRAHNGLAAGGFALPLAPGAAVMAAMTRVVLPPFKVAIPAGGSMTLSHGLGYIPDVQILSATGEVLRMPDIGVTHDDVENLTFQNNGAAAAAFNVVLG